MFIKEENLTIENIEKGKDLGYIVEAGAYNNDAEAEKDGFCWFDEIDCWVNVEKFKGYNER